jgi:hypothetical protein
VIGPGWILVPTKWPMWTNRTLVPTHFVSLIPFLFVELHQFRYFPSCEVVLLSIFSLSNDKDVRQNGGMIARLIAIFLNYLLLTFNPKNLPPRPSTPHHSRLCLRFRPTTQRVPTTHLPHRDAATLQSSPRLASVREARPNSLRAPSITPSTAWISLRLPRKRWQSLG